MTPLPPLSIQRVNDKLYRVTETKTSESLMTEDLRGFLQRYLKSRAFSSDELIELKKEVRALSGPTTSSRIVSAILGSSPHKNLIRLIDQKLNVILASEDWDKKRDQKLFGDSTVHVIYYKEGDSPPEDLGHFPLDSRRPETRDTTISKKDKKPKHEEILIIFKTIIPKICKIGRPEDRQVADYVYSILEETFFELLPQLDKVELPFKELRSELYNHIYVKLLQKRFSTETFDRELFAISLGKEAKLLSSSNIHRRYSKAHTALPIENPEVKKLIDSYNSGEWKEGEERKLELDNFPESYHDRVYNNLQSLFHNKEMKRLFKRFQ